MQHSVERVALQNGAEGLLIDVPSASVVSIDIVFRAGDYLTPEGKTDTAHVMEHLVLGANKKYPDVKEFSKEFSKFGAYDNAYTGDYHMGYEAECEAGEVDRIIDLLCVAIESPLFLPKVFEAERGNVREELKMRRNNHDLELALELENAMGFVPKSYTVRVTELDSITIDDIWNHYHKTHTASNIRFVIAGPMQTSRGAILARLESIDLPRGNGWIPLPNETPKHIKKPLLSVNNNLENVCYRWETVIPLLESNKDRDSLSAAHDLLFSGLHSKVFGELREKGLVYSIYGGSYDTKNDSVCVINGQVQAQSIQEVLSILLRELNAIADRGVDQQELDDLRRRVYGEVQRSNQTVAQLVGWYRSAFIMRDSINHFSEFGNRMQDITPQSVQSAVQAVLHSRMCGFGIMHNGQDELDAPTLYKSLLRR